jgi:hypothetical protein
MREQLKKANERLLQDRAAWRRKRQIFLFTTRGEIPLELDYAQTYGMGASGAAMVKAAPQ